MWGIRGVNPFCPDPVWKPVIREMGGAPRNLAPRNHFWARIVKPSGCHCTDGHLRINNYRRVPTPLRILSQP